MFHPLTNTTQLEACLRKVFNFITLSLGRRCFILFFSRFLRDRPLFVIFLLSVLYSCLFTSLSFTNHYSFRTLAGDLGIFNQALYSSLNFGLLFYDTIELGSHFQFHFDPILFLILPIYSFAQTPLLLLAIQSIALGFAAVPAFLISRAVLKSGSLALLISLCYLLNPSIHGINLYDFHPDCFFPLLFFSSLLFIERGRLLKSAFCMFLALMCKETAAFTVAAIGVYVAWAYRKEIPWRSLVKLEFKGAFSSRYLSFATLTVVLGVGWFVLASCMFPSVISADRHAFSWSYLGIGLVGVAKSFLTNPVGSLHAAFTPTPVKFFLLKLLHGKYFSDQLLLALVLAEPSMKSYYLLQLFFPFAFLPLMSPAVLLPAIPWILLNLSSVTPTHYTAVGYQYPSLLVPFIFFASVHATKNLVSLSWKFVSKINLAPHLVKAFYTKGGAFFCLTLVVLLCSFASFYLWSPVWLVEGGTPRDQVLHAVTSSIPPYFTVSTQGDLFPHLTPSLNLYLGHYTFMPTEYYDILVLDTCSPWYYLSGSGGLRLFYDRLAPSELATMLLASDNYTILFNFDGVLVIGRANLTQFSP
ncbi:MAG: DUF2079 domain-containing protein [Thermosphaera sp.]